MESLSPATARWQLYTAGFGQGGQRAPEPQIYPRNIVAASSGGLVAVARKITTRVAGVAVSVRYELVALATCTDRSGRLHIIFDEDDADKEIRILKTRSASQKRRRRHRNRTRRKEQAS